MNRNQKTTLIVAAAIGLLLLAVYQPGPSARGLVRNDKIGMELTVDYVDGSSRTEQSSVFQHYTPFAVVEGQKALTDIVGKLLVYAEFDGAQTVAFAGRMEVRLDAVTETYVDINQTIPLQTSQTYAVQFITVSASDIITWTSNASGLYDLTFVAIQNPFLTVTFSETSVERIFYQETYLTLNVGVTGAGVEYEPPPEEPPPPPDEPPPSPPPVNYFFADGFESGGFTGWSSTTPWGSPTPTAAATMTRSHAGSYSARIQVGPATSSSTAGYYLNRDISGLTGSDVFCRAYYYFGDMTFPTDSCLYIMQIAQSSPFVGLVTVGIGDNGGTLRWRITGYDGTSWVSQWGNAASISGWVCVEVQYHRDAASGFIKVTVNGSQVVLVSGINTTTYSAGRVRLGADRPGNSVYSGNTQLNTVVFLDDCVAHNQAIGS